MNSSSSTASVFRFTLSVAVSFLLLVVLLLTHSLYWGVLPDLERIAAGIVLAAGVISLLSARGRRIAFSVVCALFLLLALWLLAGRNAGLVFGRLGCGVAVLLTLAAASSFGLRFLTVFAPTGSLAVPERLAFAWALGMASLSLAVFAVGTAGWIGWPVAVALLAVFLLSGARLLFGLLRETVCAAVTGAETLSWVGWSALALIALGLAWLVPMGFMPPLDYDVLEYHIQLPREYYDLGQIAVMPHNTFSGFPQASEMLTLFSFMLAGGYHAEPLAQSWGIWIAKLLNLSFLPLLLLAVGCLAARLAGETVDGRRRYAGALVGAVLLLGMPQALILASKLYTELSMAAYTVLAAVAGVLASRAAGRAGGGAYRLAVLAGVCAGAAAGCKYTGVLFSGAGVAALLFLLPVSNTPLRRRLGLAAAAGIACWVLLAPWLVRNGVQTGNPFYPIWNQAAGVDGWTAAQETRFRTEHSAARHGGFGAMELVRRGWQVFVGGRWRGVCESDSAASLGLLFLVLVPAGVLLAGGRRRECLWLALWPVACFVAWYFLTNRVGRFLFPTFCVYASLSGAGAARLLAEKERWRKAAGTLLTTGLLAWVAVVASVFLVSVLLRPVEKASPVAPANRAVYFDVLSGAIPVEPLLQATHATGALRQVFLQLPPDARVLLLGAAEPFWLPASTEYAVVFARQPLFESIRQERSSYKTWRMLQKKGITHILVQWPELARLYMTYAEVFSLSRNEQLRFRNLLERFVYPVAYAAPPGVATLENLAERNASVRDYRNEMPVLFDDSTPSEKYGRAAWELFAVRESVLPGIPSR